MGGLVLAVLGAAPVKAEVRLTLVPDREVAEAGELFLVGLYAYSDSGETQAVGGVDVILEWDPAALTLVRRINNGPYAWAVSGFFNDAGLDGLNTTWADGNAFYQAVRQSSQGQPAMVPPSGLLVVTFEFRAVDWTPSARMDMPASFGQFTQTRVLDGSAASPGADITGSLHGASLAVIACGQGPDLTGDCLVGLGDYALMAPCLGGPLYTDLSVACQVSDVDGNGTADLHDFAALQLSFTGP